MRLTLVIPVYNEAKNIGAVVEEWYAALSKTVENQDFCILVLDDGSKDNTPAVLAQLKEKYPKLVLHRHTNRGHGQTCLEGYKMAEGFESQRVMQIDSDGQCDPVFFPQFWAAAQQFPIIYGRRYQRFDGLARKLISLVLRWFLYTVTGTQLHDTNAPYRIYPAPLAAATARRIPPTFDLANIAMALLIEREGFHEIPIHFRDRRGGEASVKWMGFFRKAVQLYQQLKTIRNV